MKYLEDALGVDGLAGKRHRIPVELKELPSDKLSEAQAFIVSSTYLDQAMQVSARRRVRVPVESWRDGLRRLADSMPLEKNCHEDQDAVFEERRAIPEENFL